MIPGFDFIDFAQTAGPVVALVTVAAIIFAESGLLIGFFFPGDSILFALGLLIQGTGNFKLDLNINFAILVLFIAATTGYYSGYLFGKKIGHHISNRPNSLLFHQKNVQRAQDFYDKYGGKTIMIARFIPIVRTFAPLIAGVVKMNQKSFMAFNLIGGAIWITSVVYVGYFLGYYLRGMGIDIDTIILPAIALILIVSVSPAIYQLAKDKKQRIAIWNTTKSELKKLFKKRNK